MRVHAAMTPNVVTVAPETPLRQVAKLLADNRISGVPVLDARGRLVGVVSEAPPITIAPHRSVADAAALCSNVA